MSTENEARDAEQFLRERDEQAAYVTHLEESIKVKDGALSIAAEENRRLTVALSDTEAKLESTDEALNEVEARLREIRQESAVEFDDPRLDYVTVQITRSTWESLTRSNGEEAK